MSLRRPARAAALLLACASLAVGCGGSDGADETGFEEVLASVEGLSGQARLDRLRRLAAKEGDTLSLYTSMTPGDEDEVSSAFEDEFGIEVSVYRASTEAIARRLSEEHEASFHGADVVDTNGIVLSLLGDQGILAPYRPQARTRLVSGSSHETWTGSRFNTFVLSWNTERVAPHERPRAWEDLADARWRGKLGLEAGDYDWYQTLRAHWLANGRSAAEADRLFERMARNALVVKGHSLLAQLLATGEIDVAGSNYRHVVQGFVDDGAPLAWKPVVEPVIRRAEGIALVRHARNPAAAMLYVEWMLGPGQEVIVELGRDAARRDLVATGNARSVSVDVDALVGSEDEWADRWDRLMRLGAAGPEDS
ncbi:MAG: extracellular solute-binding protein [Actinomycetota bacterium]|nr:extracellular solute-binding protein [Actinomycetota bacterium]